MWNNVSVPAKPAAPDPGATPAGGDEFYGTLDLGHEAQINNDLVRTIRAEIVEIDESLQVTAGGVKTEERSFGQLTKNSHHARGEMFSYRRDAAEVLDAESMAEDLRRGFKDQFAAEVGPHVISPSTEAAPAGEDDDEGPAQPNQRVFSHKKFIDRKRGEAKEKTASVRAIQKEIKMTRKKIKSMDDEAASYVQDTQTRQLEKVKIEGARQVEAKRRECEAENQRNRGVKEAVQVARANSGAYAQQIAEKAKVQMSERGNHVSKESAMASLNDAKQQELDLLVVEEKKVDMELATLNGQLDFLTRQATEFEAEQKRSADMKAELEEVQATIAEVAAAKEAKAKEVEASGADLQSATAAFEEASKAMAEANAEKLKNDKAVVETLEPAVARKADAIKEKEKLAGQVVALQSSLEQAQSENQDTIAASKAKVAAKTGELKEHKAKLDEARVSLVALEKDDDAAQATLASELNEYKEFATKFEAATKAEVDRLELLKQDRTNDRVKQLEKRRSELNVVEDAQQSDIENLKRLHAFLQERKEEKIKIEEEEITPDEIEAV